MWNLFITEVLNLQYESESPEERLFEEMPGLKPKGSDSVGPAWDATFFLSSMAKSHVH